MSYVAIEGIIGAGKTTLARALAKHLKWRMLEEPVESNPILPLFYQDPKKWGFCMQVRLLHNRYRMQQVAAHDVHLCILDRSLPGDRCFAKLQLRHGNMHQLEWDTYEQAYQAMSAVRPPFTMLYLMVDPAVAMARMQVRARAAEAAVPLKYLEDLAQEYESLVQDIESGRHHWSRGVRIKRIPWSKHLENPEEAAADLAPALREEVEGR